MNTAGLIFIGICLGCMVYVVLYFIKMLRNRKRLEYERERIANEFFRRWLENEIRRKHQQTKSIDDESREKMWKLYKLSVKGIGGEKQNASAMLNVMLQKKNVTLQTLLAEQKIFGKESL